MLPNPINYNFNNPILICGNRNFTNGSYIGTKEDQDTVNVIKNNIFIKYFLI